LLARTFVPPTQAGRTGWLKRLVHDGLPSALVLGALPLLVLAAHLVFRKGYYGEWVPNTYHAKVAFTAERLALGVHYLSKGALFWVLGLPCLATAVAFAKDRHRRRRVLVLLPMLLAWVSYVVAIGGDIMPQRRHLLVALVLTVLLGAEGLAWLVARGGRTSLFAYVVAVVSVAALVVQQRDDPEKTWALRDLWHWPARPIGSFFRASFGDKDPLLAVDAAGALPYFWKGRALDMLGLNDAWLAKHPPSRFGTGPLAHELGDGDYVWRRKPDIIVFHLPTGLEAAEWRGGRELQAKAEFGAFYQFVTFETPLPTRETGHAWFRKEDSSLGVQRSATQIVVPGHLLSSDRRGRIRLDPEGWVGADVWPEAPARLDFLTLKPGRWLVAAEGRGHVTLSISDGPGRQPFARGVDRVVAVVPRSTSAVTIAAELAWGDMARVRSVTLTRQ
ncbi:MAG TPA: hypothetical protein PKA88_16595, partial [Polyangiaceae bacterium]|nr:hypothetical protein [Polyangiaceae bacterium]